MKSRLLRYGLSLLIAGSAVIGFVSPARAESFSRISDIHGSLNLKGGDEKSWVQATMNLLLKEGDRLETGDEATAEIEMPGLARIRMGNRTEIRIKGYGGSNSRDEVALESGGVFVDDRDGTTVIETFSAAVSPNSGSAVRVDVDRDGTCVRVATGSVQVQTFKDGRYATRPMLLRSGEEMVLDLNARPEGPHSYHAANDALDRYWQKRVKELGLTSGYQKTGENLKQPLMGSGELDQYGEWVTVNDEPVWRPYVAADWRPYFNGYWAWYDPFGWTWISYDPFGYVTFHYGAWIYDPFYGWCWVPGYVWRPAYVGWIAIGPYFAWAPLDPWGSVVFINIDFVFVNGFDSRVFTFAPRTAFVIDHRAVRPGRGRVIPAGMRTGRSIRVADDRLFKENPRVKRIKDLNAVRPVRLERSEAFERKAAIAREAHPNRTVFPRPGRTVTREPGFIKRGHEPTPILKKGAVGLSRTPPRGGNRPQFTQETRDSVERRDSSARTPMFPRVGRPERQSWNGEIRHNSFPRADQRATVYEPWVRDREDRDVVPQELRVERRPVSNSGGVPPRVESRSVPRQPALSAPEERRTVYPSGSQPSIPNTIYSYNSYNTQRSWNGR